jgi:ABC-type branched-subunit amino acid transport system substrate-binding protein
VVVIVGIVGGVACDAPPPPNDPIRIGLLLSYTGTQAVTAANSERAILMAIEAANQAGGLDGRPIQILARDTRSDPRKADEPTRELIDAGSAVLVGPDRSEPLAQIAPLIWDRTVILPSFATSDYIQHKADSWFVMGPAPGRFACELVAQYQADGHDNAIQIVSPDSYNSTLSYVLSYVYSLPKFVLSTDQASTVETVRNISRALENADAYVLATSPDAAVSLVYALTAVGALDKPKRWYLSPTLHTPAFLQAIPREAMLGAAGVAPGNVAGAADFRAQFMARWHDTALDDAYSFYDAGALAVLSLQRALKEEQAIPTGTGLSRHLIAITKAGGTPVRWNEIGLGLELLRQGQEIEYVGLNGQFQFDAVGKTQVSTTKWWTIGQEGFVDTPHGSDCR